MSVSGGSGSGTPVAGGDRKTTVRGRKLPATLSLRLSPTGLHSTSAAALRLLALPGRQLSAMNAGRLVELRPVSRENDAAALGLLQQLTSEALALYSTSLQYDEAIFAKCERVQRRREKKKRRRRQRGRQGEASAGRGRQGEASTGRGRRAGRAPIGEDVEAHPQGEGNQSALPFAERAAVKNFDCSRAPSWYLLALRYRLMEKRLLRGVQGWMSLTSN